MSINYSGIANLACQAVEFKLLNMIKFKGKARWRNWQTRTVQSRISLNGGESSILSLATWLFMPEWRNWQTRNLEEVVPIKGVEVQVLSPAPTWCPLFHHMAEFRIKLIDFLQFLG